MQSERGRRGLRAEGDPPCSSALGQSSLDDPTFASRLTRGCEGGRALGAGRDDSLGKPQFVDAEDVARAQGDGPLDESVERCGPAPLVEGKVTEGGRLPGGPRRSAAE